MGQNLKIWTVCLVAIFLVAIMVIAVRPRKQKWVKFSKNEYTYKALITPKNNGWESPFTINGRPIFYADERGIIKSLKGCMVQEQFKDQLAQLIAARKVIRSESKEE